MDSSYGQRLGVVYLNVTNFHLTAIYNTYAFKQPHVFPLKLVGGLSHFRVVLNKAQAFP